MHESEMSEQDRAEYELMTQLERLESIQEEMEELGVSSLAEVKARIQDLNRKLDQLQQAF